MTRFGLIGTGHWARTTHGAALAAHPGVTLAGVWGRRADAAAALAAELGIAAYPSVDVLLADVDAVAFALPPTPQAQLAVRAAAAGKHLLLEKPLALQVSDADAVVTAVRAAGVRSVVFCTRRFDPATIAALATPAAGGWQAAELTISSSIFQPGSPYLDSTWRRERGALWDLGPHTLSLAVPLLGPVTAVVGQRGPGDTVALVTRHGGGGVATHLLSLTTPRPAVRTRLLVSGPAGSVQLPTDVDARVAYHAAIDALVGTEPIACDAGFGRDAVAVLAEAERALG